MVGSEGLAAIVISKVTPLLRFPLKAGENACKMILEAIARQAGMQRGSAVETFSDLLRQERPV